MKSFSKLQCSFINVRNVTLIGVVTLISIGYSEKPVSNVYANFNRSLIVSPQSAALGNSDLSSNEGALPGYSPSNLTKDTFNLVALSYANYFNNTFSTSSFSFVDHIDQRSSFSVAAGYIFIPDIEDNRNLDTNEAGDPRIDKEVTRTNCSHIYFRGAYGLSYGKLGPVQFSSGVALNGSRIRLIDYKGYGISLDLGTTISFVNPGIALTALLENVTGSYTYWNSSYSEYGLPHLKLGAGWERSFKYLYGKLKLGYTSPDLLSNEGINDVTVDEQDGDLIIHKPESHTIKEKPIMLLSDANYGIEYTILNVVALRGGKSRDRFSFGAGLLLFSQRAGIDFAYIVHALAGTYQVSLAYRW